MKTLPLTALMLTLLSGCSLFQVNTNLDKKNFTEYFKPSSVAVMDKTQVLDVDAKPIGTVEGESCQTDDTQPIPNITDAQTSARKKSPIWVAMRWYSVSVRLFQPPANVSPAWFAMVRPIRLKTANNDE